MKALLVLIAVAICGCASQGVELTQAEQDRHIFYEEPKIEYEILGRVDTTSPANHPMETLNKIRGRAVELGADGIIVHAIFNKGTVAGQHDRFGTGGGDGKAVYQIQASAIRYIE